MKKLVLTFAFLLTFTVAFAQQLPIRIVNNTTQTVTINLIEFYGADPLNPPVCSGCGYTFHTDTFTIGPSLVWYVDTYAALDATVTVFGTPCATSGCTSGQAKGNCDFSSAISSVPATPVWAHLSFTHPNLTARIGDPACGFSDFESGGGITASWQYPVSNEILVVFN